MASCRFLASCTIALILAAITASAIASEIHQAVFANDLQQFNALIAGDKTALNLRDDTGRTPLTLAAELGRNEMAAALIAAGADVNLGNDKGSSALHLATVNGRADIVRLLLESGADIEARDALQRTPLITAAECKDLEVTRLLLANGADINAVAARGYTAILWGARNQHEEYVDLLVDAKAAIAPNDLPRAFELAVVGGMERLYQYALDLGCNITSVRERDPGLIFPAAAGGSLEIVKSLVEHGFDPIQTDPNGYTTIHGAAMNGHVEVLRYLRELGLDMNARNLKGETAYNAATMLEQHAVTDYLRECGADTSAPHYPILTGPYMGQEPPGEVPKLFLPGIVSGHYRAHSALTFSPDGLEAYWTEMRPGEAAVLYSHTVNGVWTYPVFAAVDRDPLFAPDGKRLYFIKTRPYRDGDVRGGDSDFKEEYWYLERTAAGWSAPIPVGDEVNSIGLHWPCSVDNEGNLYFSEFADNMYLSRYRDGKYGKPTKLTEAFGNQTLIGSCPFISPGSDYLIYVAGSGLSICFKKKDGTWTDGVSLGGTINASHVNGSPRVTADGKYLFFVSAGQGRPWGIYWVSAEFVERLRREHVAIN